MLPLTCTLLLNSVPKVSSDTSAPYKPESKLGAELQYRDSKVPICIQVSLTTLSQLKVTGGKKSQEIN
jgi:hypothetical protein